MEALPAGLLALHEGQEPVQVSMKLRQVLVANREQLLCGHGRRCRLELNHGRSSLVGLVKGAQASR
jgi:hypothetical protein